MSESFVIPEAASDLNPSEKLCWAVIQLEQPTTFTEIRKRTQMSSYTVQSAVETLDDLGLVEGRDSMTDLRKREYRTVGEHATEVTT